MSKKPRKLRGEGSFQTIDECVRYLKQHGLLKPGVTIPTSVFEHLIGRKASDSWAWRGPYLLLKEAIENEGFFTSSRGLAEEDLKIIESEHVWLHSKKRSIQRKKRTEKDHSIVVKTPTAELDEMTLKRHMHEMNKLARTNLRLAEILDGKY